MTLPVPGPATIDQHSSPTIRSSADRTSSLEAALRSVVMHLPARDHASRSTVHEVASAASTLTALRKDFLDRVGGVSYDVEQVFEHGCTRSFD